MVTDVYISNKKALNIIKPIKDQLQNISAMLQKADYLVQQGVMAVDEIKDITDTYKLAVKTMVQQILADAITEAVIEAIGAEGETNDKLKGITPIISGVPVISPPPAASAISVAALLTLGLQAADELNTLIADITKVTG